MIPYNETSFREKVNPFCINCGSDNIVVFDYPFCKNAIITVPMICDDCDHRFSLQWEICPESMISRKERGFE